MNASQVAQKSLIGPVIVSVYYANYPRTYLVVLERSIVQKVRNEWIVAFMWSPCHISCGARSHLNRTGKTIFHTDVLVRDPDHQGVVRP